MRLTLSGRVGLYSLVCAFVVGAELLYYADPDRQYLGFSGARIALVPLLILLGVVLLLRSLFVRSNEDRDAASQAPLLTSPGSQPPRALAPCGTREAGKGIWTFTFRKTDPEARLRQLLSNVRAFGLIAAVTICVVLLPSWLFHARSQPNSVGLRVFLLRPSKGFMVADQWSDSLVVRVGAEGLWSLNGKQVGRSELLSKLQRALSLRAGKVVFVGGEDSNSWASVVEVIDTIQGACDAKVVLLGRESGEEVSSPAATRTTTQPSRN